MIAFVVTGGEDYAVPPNRALKVKFSAGVTRASANVALFHDGKIEHSETFRLVIFELSLPYGISYRPGSARSVIVTIIDNDRKLIYTLYYENLHVHTYVCQLMANVHK